MTANQIPYDRLDWLQIAIYFLALPIVALLGAAIGLLGRWRRGGMLWSTNVGLLGGAVACGMLTLGISTMSEATVRSYFEEYVLRFRWNMLIAATLATLCCSLIAAIAWRFLHTPREIQPVAFSLRALLLVQIFVFTALGSFVGLRLSVLRAVGQNESTQHLIPIRGWRAVGDDEIVVDPDLQPEQIPQAYSADRLREIARRPRLRSVNFELDGSWRIDLTPLQREAGYESIGAMCRNPDQSMIEQLAKLNAKRYWLDGDFSNLDLSPIASSEHLSEICLTGKHSRTTLELLGQNERIRNLLLLCKLPREGPPLSRWPAGIRKLQIDSAAVIENRDLKALANHPSLEVFDAIGLTLNEESLAALQSIGTLRQAKLVVGPLTPGGYESLANLDAPHVMLIVKNPNLVRTDVEQMLRAGGLEVLDLYYSTHTDEGLDLIAKKEKLIRINIASPRVTAQGMLRLAALPKLYHLGYPKHLSATSFVEDFHAKRSELGLPFVTLVANQRTPAQTTTSMSEPTP